MHTAWSCIPRRNRCLLKLSRRSAMDDEVLQLHNTFFMEQGPCYKLSLEILENILSIHIFLSRRVEHYGSNKIDLMLRGFIFIFYGSSEDIEWTSTCTWAQLLACTVLGQHLGANWSNADMTNLSVNWENAELRPRWHVSAYVASFTMNRRTLSRISRRRVTVCRTLMYF